MFDAVSLSKAIRAKKKALKTDTPELVGTSPVPDMNAQDVYDMEQLGRIEETLDVPAKSDADFAEVDNSIGLTDEEKTRMSRLRSYFDKMDL